VLGLPGRRAWALATSGRVRGVHRRCRGRGVRSAGLGPAGVVARRDVPTCPHRPRGRGSV